MALVAFKCIAELNIQEITAPGIRLANKDELFLNVCMLGQQRRTRLVSPYFPLEFNDTLRFEKTFKYCRDICDVVNFLDDLHVLMELVQLGRCKSDEVLACYEANAKEFLYPTPDTRACYHCCKRDLFMTRSNQLPGTISPQLKFYVSLRIFETHTPATDILDEYSHRFVHDPIYEIAKQRRRPAQPGGAVATKKKNRIVKAKNQRIADLIEPVGENFASHTISSAIKADYGQYDVRAKLEELNDDIKRTRIVKYKPEYYEDDSAPFVVRRVQDSLIMRNPKSHDVLNDGLVVTQKDGYRNQRSRSRSRSAPGSRSLSRQSRNSRSRSRDGAITPNFHLSHSHLLDSPYEAYKRSRSLSPSGCRHVSCEHLTVSDCDRSWPSARRRGSNSRVHFRTSFAAPKRARSAIGSRARLSRSRSPRFNTKVGSFSGSRDSGLNRHNSGSIFNSSSSFHTKDPLNQTVLLNSDLDRKITRGLNKRANHNARARKGLKIKDIDYQRYYPWLGKYADYLANLECELDSLRLRRQQHLC